MSDAFQLRPVQTKALDGLRDSLRAGHRRPQLELPTGSGKTLIAAEMVKGARAKGKRVAFVAPLLNLIDQTIKRFVSYGIDIGDIGVIQGDHERRWAAAPVQICSVQTLAKRTLPEVDLVIPDECFAAGTMIATPLGPRPIEMIRPGDIVFNAVGIGIVEKRSRKMRRTIAVGFSNGAELNVTPNHKIFTERGWVQAGLLASEKAFSREAVHRMWQDISSFADGCGIDMERAEVLLDILRQEIKCGEGNSCGTVVGQTRISGCEDMPLLRKRISTDKSRSGVFLEEAQVLLSGLRSRESAQPDVDAWSSGDCFEHSEIDWTWRLIAGREWQADADAASDAVESARRWVGQRSCDPDWAGASQSLQDRYCASRNDDSDRGGRSIASIAERAGSTERRIPEIARVVGVSRVEQGRYEPVYDLRVSGHPSYFAEGILVHNSHYQYGIIYRWMERCPKTTFVGLSATPWARGMADHYDDLVKPASIGDLIDCGDLCDYRIFAPSRPDLSKVRVVAGEYVEGELSAEMSRKEIVGDVVRTWCDLGEDRPTLVFAVDRGHASVLHDRFESVGVRSAYIDANTRMEEREEIIRRFHDGDIRVINSIDTMKAGIDLDVRCIVYARPSKSEIAYVQAIGRGLRNADGKDHLLVLDHSNCTLEMGTPRDISFDRLRSARAKNNVERALGDRAKKEPKECPKCHTISDSRTRECMNCGHVFKLASSVREREGELVDISLRNADEAAKERRRANRVWDKIAKAYFFGELQTIAAAKGYKSAWAAWKYRERFDVWPNDPEIRGARLQPVSPETASWLRSMQIKQAKSKEKAER